MLPSRYRGRYSLFILLSLLVHFTVVVALFWVADEKEELKEDKTVIVTLKKKEEPKKEEPKKEEPKKEEPKKEEPKKEEPKKEEPKKEEPKKAKPKKEESKKAKPKKAEPKKEEPKKEEPKKEEPKKEESKKAKPKKAEPNKGEPKKAKSKKAELDKPKLNELQKPPMIHDSMSQYPVDNDLPEKAEIGLSRFGSMEMLDERSMSELVVSTQSLDRKFDDRDIKGEQKKKELNFFQKQEFNSSMQLAMNKIEKFITPVKWDGGKYYGEINFFVDINGKIEKIVIKKPSGSDDLDKSMIRALIKTKNVPMPYDKKALEVMYLTKKLLFYSEKDMIR